MNNQKMALHAVIVKKPVELDEAKQVAQHFINDPKKKFVRETASSFRFRNIPKGHFIPKSYKTKKINKQVSIIIGHLKPQHEHLEGSGLGDFFKKIGQKVKSVFTPRLDNYNNQTRKSLEQYGNMPVKRLTIYRTPIMKILDKVLNLVSFGKFSELKKKYGFDQLYHLALIADVGNKNLVIEKNEVINVSTSYSTSSKTEKQDIPLDGKEFTINEMFQKGRETVGDKKWFLYHPFSNNCQSFIKYCLEAVGLYGTPEKDFLFQDLAELTKELPSLTKKIAKGVTDVGAVVNKLRGKGNKNKMKKYSKAEKHFINYIKDQKLGDYFDIEEIFQKWAKTSEGMKFLAKHLNSKEDSDSDSKSYDIDPDASSSEEEEDSKSYDIDPDASSSEEEEEDEEEEDEEEEENEKIDKPMKYYLFKFNKLKNNIGVVADSNSMTDLKKNVIIGKNIEQTDEIILLKLNKEKAFKKNTKDPLKLIGGPIKVTFKMFEITSKGKIKPKYSDTVNKKGQKETDKRNIQMLYYTPDYLNKYGIRLIDLKKIALLAVTDKLEKKPMAKKLITQIL